MQQSGKTPMEAAVAILSKRACTTSELKRKLLRKSNYTEEEVSSTIMELENRGVMSDLQYTQDFVRIMRDRGYGDQRILEKLLLKGIERTMAMEILCEDMGNRDPFNDAMQLLERRARRLDKVADPQKRNHRILCMLAGRGFSPEVAYRVITEWSKRKPTAVNPDVDSDYDDDGDFED